MIDREEMLAHFEELGKAEVQNRLDRGYFGEAKAALAKEFLLFPDPPTDEVAADPQQDPAPATDPALTESPAGNA